MRIALVCPFLSTNDGDLTVLKAMVNAVSARLPGARFVAFFWGDPGEDIRADKRIRCYTIGWPRMPWGVFELLSRLAQAILYRLLLSLIHI